VLVGFSFESIVHMEIEEDDNAFIVGVFHGGLSLSMIFSLYVVVTGSVLLVFGYQLAILGAEGDSLELAVSQMRARRWPLFAVGFAFELLSSGSFLQAVQFGFSLLIWGVFVRTVVVWHVTWSVNSLAHLFGYRNYNTSDDSRNNWFVALMTFGEGWHNNHHADARSARHGHRWFEIDLTFSVIQLLECVGLATNVVRPSKRVNDDKKIDMLD
jgi:hypothetical protein